MAARANIIIDQGTTFEVDINVANDDGTPLDLTNYTGAAQLRKHYSSANSIPFTVQISNAELGVLTLGLTANTTTSIVAGRYVYDVEITSSVGTVLRVVEGQVTVTPQVTR